MGAVQRSLRPAGRSQAHPGARPRPCGRAGRQLQRASQGQGGRAGVLWAVAPSLVLFLLAYAAAATGVTVWAFARRLMQLQFRILRCEGDLRFQLVRTRENAGARAPRPPPAATSDRARPHGGQCTRRRWPARRTRARSQARPAPARPQPAGPRRRAARSCGQCANPALSLLFDRRGRRVLQGRAPGGRGRRGAPDAAGGRVARAHPLELRADAVDALLQARPCARLASPRCPGRPARLGSAPAPGG